MSVHAFKVAAAAVCVAAGSVVMASAQAQAPQTSMAGGLTQLYRQARTNVLEAAELMPEEHYAYQPAPDVRTYGQLVGHVTNTHYNFCSAARSITSPARINHETLKTKAELVAALKASIEFCDVAYTDLTDAQLLEATTFGQMNVARGYNLTYNVVHDNEHYGNMVTYLRMKGLVPPSTARVRR
jgi:uncharacterized damage-inducible protein DinB